MTKIRDKGLGFFPKNVHDFSDDVESKTNKNALLRDTADFKITPVEAETGSNLVEAKQENCAVDYCGAEACSSACGGACTENCGEGACSENDDNEENAESPRPKPLI